MNKRSIPITIVGCILALAGLAGYFMPTPTEANPNRLLMENAGGRVVFTHQAHATPGGAYGDNQCMTCHHELKVAPAPVHEGKTPSVMNCTACHGATDQPDFIASHQKLYAAKGGDATCVTCHHTIIDGFSKAWNHDDHMGYAGEDCATCHHESSYEYKPGKIMNIKPQKCSNCHTAKANPMTATVLKDAAHAKCAECHSDWIEESGAEGCATCHGQKSTAQELAAGKDVRSAYTSCSSCHASIPASMDAFHNQCRSCHDTMGRGPGVKAPCAQCHTP